MQIVSRSSRDLEGKREQEKVVVTKMIEIYCRGHKHTSVGLCNDCLELSDYASIRVDRCPFMETKTFCSTCRVHCYKPDMRTKIREVMRYSGPRMLFRHPILTMRHLHEEWKQKQTERGNAP
jgi:hypothetical protein